jgi:hypothetical protein
LKFSDFNLRVGYPSSLEIEAGCIQEKYFEVPEENSLVYIGFATSSYDINFELSVFDNTSASSIEESIDKMDDQAIKKSNFKSLLKLEKIDSSLNPVKIVLFFQKRTTIRITWDNSYSWFTSKSLRFRQSILKPVTTLDFNKIVDFSALKTINHKVDQGTIVITNDQNNKKSQEDKAYTLKYEGKQRIYKINDLVNKHTAITSNSNFYTSIGVFLNKSKIRIVDLEKQQTNEYNKESQSLEENSSYQSFFESVVNSYLDKVSYN